jgi:UDP-glucose 4-epimerase
VATFLVTGGCGFIGSHLCAALRARGDVVRVLDDLSTGLEANLAPGATLIRGDVADPAAAGAAMEGVEGCFHLAAIASVERGVQDWLGTHRANLTGTITLLDAAARRGGVPVVYASSAAVYGDAASPPLAEDAPTRPLSAYGADKLGCELHARVAGAVHGVPTLGLRFFNVFGPRQDPRSPYSGVISVFCDRLSRGEAVQVFGDGAQTRDFVFVADVAAALLAAMPAASPTAPVLNVCTGRPTSVLELAREVASLCDGAPDLRHGPPRAGEIRHSLGSRARGAAALGLPPPTGLREGLAEVVAWLRAGRPGLAGAGRRVSASP